MFTKKSYFLQKYSSTFFTGIWRTLTVFQSNWKNIPTPLEKWLNMELTDLIKFTKSTRSRRWLNLRKNEVGFYNSVFPTFTHFIGKLENFKHPFLATYEILVSLVKINILQELAPLVWKYEVAAIENKDHVFAAREDRKIENYGREMGQKIHLTFVLC